MIEKLCIAAKSAASELASASTEKKNQALLAMATAIANRKNEIITVNQQDVSSAKNNNKSAAFIDRLTITEQGVDNMVAGLKKIADLKDPVGIELKAWQVPSGLKISRVSIPLGVIAVIYESRPNVTADAAALCLKAGNAVILRGGSECAKTNQIIADCLQDALREIGLPESVIQYMPTQAHAAVDELLQMDQYVDVIVPRGGRSLIEHIRDKSRIPLFSHLEGLCHTYVHRGANKKMATNIIRNAKMRRTGICGATETLLIDHAIAKDFLPDIITVLIEEGCEVRGDEQTQTIDSRVAAANESDWSTEYLDAIISIRVIDGIDQAISHIHQYGTHHTEAIITDDLQAATQFLNQINSAIVMHNTSTQFADGGEFGMGAEIGIATGKLHARGPVGVEQLTTFKYIVRGTGQVRP